MLTLYPWFPSYPISTYGTSPVRTIPSNLRFVAQKPHIFTKSETPPISIHIFPLVYAWFIFPLGIWINHHIPIIISMVNDVPIIFPSYQTSSHHLLIAKSPSLPISTSSNSSNSSHLHIFSYSHHIKHHLPILPIQEWFQELLSQNLKPDSVSYTTLMEALAKSGEMALAERRWAEKWCLSW